jgi:hypothetical protein
MNDVLASLAVRFDQVYCVKVFYWFHRGSLQRLAQQSMEDQPKSHFDAALQ